jgi:uncharacterized protein (DUF1778 family)
MCGNLPYTNAMATATRTERLDARVSREEKEIIETAANLRGTSFSDFVRIVTKEAALKTIREHEVLTLSEKSRQVFVEALLNPPKPNAKLTAAARRLRQEIG